MKFFQVKGNTYCIDTGMTYIPVYKINEKEIIMLDTGWADGEREGLDGLIDEMGFKVAGIIASHAHIDHVGNNQFFKEKHGSIIAMCGIEAQLCTSFTNLCTFYSSGGCKNTMDYYKTLLCDVDVFIGDSDSKTEVAGVEFGIIHTPGHSPGHISIITPDNVGYMGDALMTRNSMEGSKIPYSFIMPVDINTKKMLLDVECDKFIMAHKGVEDDIHGLIEYNIEYMARRVQVLCDTIRDGMSFEEIVKEFIKECGIRIKDNFYFVEIFNMIKPYVYYLEDLKKIEMYVDDGVARYKKC